MPKVLLVLPDHPYMTAVADEIWAILREFAAGQKELQAAQKETGRLLREQSQATDRLLKEQSQATDRLLKEQSQATDRKIKEVTQAIGRLGNRLGDFIEDAVRPSAVRLFRERGIDVHEVHQNVKSNRGNEGLEIDLLVVNDTDVVAIECKSNLVNDDITEHVERLEKLKRLLPKYADSRVLGAVAAMVIPDNVAQYAYRQGLFVIGQSGEHLFIRNDEQFIPKVW